MKFALALVLAAASGVCHAQATTRYTLTPLGGLNLGTSITVAVAPDGTAGGYAPQSTPRFVSANQAVLWSAAGALSTVTVPSDVVQSFVVAVGNAGVAAGAVQRLDSFGNAFTRGFVSDPVAGYAEIGTFGGIYSAAAGLNARGDVVGSALTGGSVQHAHAFLWTRASGLRDLGTFGAIDAYAVAVDDQGRIAVNTTTRSGSYRPLLVTSRPRPVNLVGLGGTYASVHALNNRSQAVGDSTLRGSVTVTHPFIWDNGSVRDLGLLRPEDNEGVAYGINDGGVIVGGVSDPSGSSRTAVVWDPTGHPVDLNTLVDAAGGFHLDSAYAVNAGGAIVGIGTDSHGRTLGFLLRPVP